MLRIRVYEQAAVHVVCPSENNLDNNAQGSGPSRSFRESPDYILFLLTLVVQKNRFRTGHTFLPGKSDVSAPETTESTFPFFLP